MNRKILLIICFIVFSQILSYSQNSTNSPYSRYGFGDLSGFSGKFQSMGGTAIGIRSNSQLNYYNPAAFTNLDTLSFTWEFGLNGSYTEYSTTNTSMSKLNANINSMGFGFPVSGWWYTGVGLQPYSSVGYNIALQSSYTSPWGTLQNVESFYEGSGGLSQVIFSNGFKVNKKISLGVNVKYLFGTIDHTRILNYLEEEGNTDPEMLSTIVSDQTIVSDFIFDVGLQFTHEFNNENVLVLGLITGNENGLKSYTTSEVIVGNSFGLIDTIYSVESEKDEIILPMYFGAGFSYKYNNILIAADYQKQDWSNSTFFGKKDSLADMSRLSVGLEYIPNKRSIKYLSRVNYRAGFHTANTYLNLHGEQLQEYGISLGLGLPINRGLSMINVAFEYGQRGTIDNNLIKENYGLLSLNISLHDIWFIKRRFN